MLADGVEGWGVKWFGVKPPHWAIRTGNLIKRAQGLMLLGLNPTFLINNALNNLVTLGWDGLLSFSPVKQRRSWLKKMGVNPLRLRAGANMAEIGDLKASDFDGMGRQIKEASRAGDVIQSMDDFARGADKFAVVANLSQKFEQWSSELATVNSMRSYWDQFWIEGRAISKMPDDLSNTLDAFDPGLSKRVKRAIKNGKTKAEIEKMIFSDLGKPALGDVLGPEEKALLNHFPGLVDEMESGLAKAEKPEDIRGVFTKARERVRDEINNQIRTNAARMTQEAANKVRIEGGQGLLDMFDLQMQERHDFWLLHFQKMEDLAEEAEKYSGKTRQAIWRKGLEDADRDWKAYENVEGSKWLGALEGLGIEDGDPTYTEAMNILYGQRGNWNDYFQKRRTMMDAFYELSYGTTTQARRLEMIGLIPGASEQADTLNSQSLWRLVNEALNTEYVNSVLAEDGLQRNLDDLFAAQYAAQFPDNPNALTEAMGWRDAVRNVRQRMAATMVLYRNGGQVMPGMEAWATMLPPEMIVQIQNLTKLLPPWVIDKVERGRIAKEFYQTIYTPYIREMLDASNGNAPAPGKPMPQPPTSPTGATSVGQQSPQVAPAVSPEMAIIDDAPAAPQSTMPDSIVPPATSPEPASVATAAVTVRPDDASAQPKPETPALSPAEIAAGQAVEIARANQTGVFKLAAEYGIGSTAAGDRIHILNILKQRFRVTDIAQVSPDMARQAFQDRALFKGAVDLEAQQILDRRILQFRADQMRRNQEAMLPEPRSFTRDAFYREAQQAIGDEQAGAVVEVVDAIAQHWADENGKTVDDWYNQTMLERGGVEGGSGLAQAERISKLKTAVETIKNDIDSVPARKEVEAFLAEEAEPFRELRLNPETWETEFGETGVVNSAVGPLTFGVGTRIKMLRERRAAFFGLLRPTVERPSFVIAKDDGTHLFVKGFVGKKGQITFMVVARDIDGNAIVVSSYPAPWHTLKKEIKAGELLKLPGEDAASSSPGFQLPKAAGGSLDTSSLPDSGSENNSLEQGQKGLTRWLDNGKAVIHAFEAADVSTFVHEVAHVWLPQMGEKDIRTVEGWLRAEYGMDLPAGWQHGTLDHVQAKEHFARAFERYLAEGRAPVPSMRRVFENFKRWLTNIYGAITGSDIDVKLNDEIVGLFDNWMGKKVEPAPAAPVSPAVTRDTVIGTKFTYAGNHFVVDHDGGDHGWYAVRFEKQPEGTTQGLWHIDRLLDVINGKVTDDALAPSPEMPVSTIVQDAPAAPPTPAIAPGAGAQVRRNPAHQGIEISFPAKPDADTISKIKAQGFRWSSREKVWYKKEKPGDFDRVQGMFSSPAPKEGLFTPAEPTIVPAVSDRWPTALAYHLTHPKSNLKDYIRLVRQALVDGELGFEEAKVSIGEGLAKQAMYDRLTDTAHTLTQKQFMDAAADYVDASPDDLRRDHHTLVVVAQDMGKTIPDEVLREYPDLFIAKEPETPTLTNIWEGTETPKVLWDAPSGQGSLFDEEMAGGFNLTAQKAGNETFKPAAGQQGALFGLGEFTQAPIKPVIPQSEDLGPLFAPADIAKAVDAGEVPAVLPAAPNVDDLRAAIQQAIYERAANWQGPTFNDQTLNVVRLFNSAPIPGFEDMTLAKAGELLGVDELKKLLFEAKDQATKPQPPVSSPITIQPNGTENFIREIARLFSTKVNPFDKPRDFEEFAQAMMGMDMNDELNLNRAYDALEGAFNLMARDTRRGMEIVKGRPLTAAESIEAMASLENKLLRARRTVAKMKLQQFSTPLTISEAAGRVADVRPGDVVLEPTAGTGNLVDRFYGRSDIKVLVNEIDEARQDVLRSIGYDPTGIDAQSGEWVIGPNGKRLPALANIVISNPPWGAYSTGKYGRPVNIPVELNDWSQRFTYLIMQRMAEGGRFSGVMPTNWVYTMDRTTRAITVKRSKFLQWLEQTYHVRAIVESPPDAYIQRGTGIGSLLIVFDKSPKPNGAKAAIEAWGENAPKTWGEYASLVEQLEKGGTHERATFDIRTGQAPVNRAFEDEINARRPATGPDAAGLADPNARAGKPEPAVDRIGQPGAGTARSGDARARQPGLGDTSHTAGSIGDLLGNRGAVIPNGKNRVGPDGRIITESPAKPSDGRPNTAGGIGESGSSGPVRGTDGDRISGQQPGSSGDAGQPTGDRGDLSTGMVGEQPAGVRATVPGTLPEEAAGQSIQPDGQLPERIEGVPGGAAGVEGSGAGRNDDVEYQRGWKETVDAVERAGAFTGYVGRSSRHLGDYPLNHHPSTVVETKALSGVQYPELEVEYQPTPGVMEAYRRGDLSIEGQLDPVWAAVQQNDKHHMGMLIADDVGMGKSRTAPAFALDRIERGQKRILFITKNRDLVADSMNESFPMIFGQNKARFVEISGDSMKNVKNGTEPIPTYPEPTVYFLPASQIDDFTEQLKVLGVESVIVDEAHVLKNVDETIGGAAWTALHKDWVRSGASFMYLTATPATDLAEMKYLYGLKLWTVDGFGDWVGVITGQITPEQAKKADDAGKAFAAYVESLSNAVREEFGEPTHVRVNGKDEIGYQISQNLVYTEGTKADTGSLWVVGRGFALKVYTGDSAKTALIGKYLREDGDLSQVGDYTRKHLVESAGERVRTNFPPPKFDSGTREALGMKDGSDALTELDKKGRKKFGSKRSAFESTLPPEHTEQIMREMKITGSYMSRDISRLGVEFDPKNIPLSPDQLVRLDKRIDLYRDVIMAYQEFAKMNETRKMDPGVAGDIQAEIKRAMFDLRLQQALPEVESALARGEKVVISLVSVSESDPEKGGYLKKAIDSINTDRVEDMGDGEYSAPEEIPEAKIRQIELMERAVDMGVLQSPVELLRAKFGDRIGFIIGKVDVKQRRATSKAFQNNDLDIVVISGAGKTGINLHDIDGQRRVHLMVVDYDWSATEFKQELGRVDRTGQKTAPKVTVFHTGNAGEVKFISTITNRMKFLGATSKGGSESTGTGSLNENFEIGSTYDKSALNDTWINLSRDDKTNFLDKYFWSGDSPKATLPETANTIKKFLLALQSMKVSEGNKILNDWMIRRERLMGEMKDELAVRAAMQRGEVLRRTKISNNLELVEVRDQTGGRFAIATGNLTPYMSKLAGIMGGKEVEFVNGEFRPVQWRHWVGFQDQGSDARISGLIIPPGKIEAVAKTFNASVKSHRSPATALQDLRAGDKMPIRGPGNAEWELYIGKGGFREGKIVVGGAKMAHRTTVMNNGALFDARAGVFYVPEDKLQDFLRRFPLREGGDSLAQNMPAGETYAFGPSGQRYQFRYKVISLDELIQSHTDTFDNNPKYPRELQPRNRDRVAYREQVQEIAQRLDERALTDTHLVDSGTPITGPDKVVENGNGRVMAMRRARMDYPESWKNYQAMLRAQIAEYGLTDDALSGIKDPVLVRERITDVDRVAFANEAQASQSMQLTVDELASTDAKYIDDAALSGLTVGDEQSIEGALKSPSNRDLVNAFLSKIPAGEKSAFLAPDGSLSNDGLTRLRNAMFVHVYPGDAGRRLANAFLVTQSDSISNIRAAIFDTLGIMSQSEALIKQGRRADELSIADDLARAVDQYARLKASGESVSDYIQQMPMFPGEDDLTPFQRKLLEYIHLNNRSRRKMRELLALYADNVVTVQQDPAQMDMFGGARAGKGEILDAAAQQVTGQDAGFAATAPAIVGSDDTAASASMPAAETAGLASIAGNDGVDQSPATSPTPAMGAPLGTADEFTEPPIEEAMLEGWMKEIEPMLARAEKAMLDEGNRKTGVMDLNRDLDQPTKKALKKYLGQVGADMTDAKLGMMRYGESRRDFALLNYQARTGMDNMLGTVMPYEFWYTRSLLNWAVRALSKPAILANWARLRNLQEKMTEGEGNVPTRLKKKVKVSMPYLPDWMGGGTYVDPLKQLFPFEQMVRPWEEMAEQKNMELRKAETILTKMVEEEEITEDGMRQAMTQQSGPIWEQAIAQARNEMDENINDPLDFAFMASGPSLPIGIAKNMLSGNKDRISQLPITRLIQANTAAMGIGGNRGINIEAPLRKATGLPEVDRFEDYRVDRMLANLAAEGLVSADDAQRAMIDRAGPAFDMAQKRVSSMGVYQYWGSPLGADMFPEGEKELRDLKTVYDKARAKWAAGDKNALTEFYDEYPEYEARAASFKDPEPRMRNYMIAEVWDRYMALPDLHRKQVREQLGATFQDAFLDKETRSYDTINTTTLASWAQMMGARNPAKAPDAPQMNLDLAPANVAAAMQAYNDTADERFPQFGAVLGAMDQMDEITRKQVMNTPQMQAYYKWKNAYLADHPEILPWVTSEKSELYGLPVDVQAKVYGYRARKDEMFPGIERTQTAYFEILDQAEGIFPGIGQIEDAYFELSTSERKKFLKQYPELGDYWDWKDTHTDPFLRQHPELPDYWQWRKAYSAANQEAAPYILSDQTMQRDLLGDDAYDESVDLTTFSDELLQSLAAVVYTGEELGSGAWMELDARWEEAGQPYGDLEKWVDNAVKPALRGG